MPAGSYARWYGADFFSAGKRGGNADDEKEDADQSAGDNGMLMLLQTTPNIPDGALPRPDRVEELSAGKTLRCRKCGHIVTTAAERVEKEGRHLHVFGNPGGFIFEIGCFSHAPGCLRHGASTMEFTWFPGYAWRFALCKGCLIHLGWVYLADADGFFGLIVDRLAEG